MSAFVLTDLYVPARLGSPRELQIAAEEAGLDALVRVAEDPLEAPTDDELAECDPNGPLIVPATGVSGPGFRFACIFPPAPSDQGGAASGSTGGDGAAAPSLESLEATGDPRLVQATVASLGGVALPIAPRQGPTGSVSRQPPALDPGGRVGVVALTIAASRLGRDLDLEDTVIAERPVLGGSGPFATLDELGRYASLLPVKARGGDGALAARVPAMALLDALARGRGFAVELGSRRPQLPGPDPNEGRDDGEPTRTKRRRRRKRSNKPQG